MRMPRPSRSRQGLHVSERGGREASMRLPSALQWHFDWLGWGQMQDNSSLFHASIKSLRRVTVAFIGSLAKSNSLSE